jgi:predicted ABC-type ATPase
MNAPPDTPVCRIIAGPNDAGKTTFALKFLPEVAAGSVFLNADLIAGGLSPLAPEHALVAASRMSLRQIEQHVSARREVAFETTLSKSPAWSVRNRPARRAISEDRAGSAGVRRPEGRRRS